MSEENITRWDFYFVHVIQALLICRQTSRYEDPDELVRDGVEFTMAMMRGKFPRAQHGVVTKPRK
jgi:hypothetical protein